LLFVFLLGEHCFKFFVVFGCFIHTKKNY
jgi:hypothetical protein